MAGCRGEKQSVWLVSLGLGALAGILLCLAALVCQSAEIGRLWRELEDLRQDCRAGRGPDSSTEGLREDSIRSLQSVACSSVLEINRQFLETPDADRLSVYSQNVLSFVSPVLDNSRLPLKASASPQLLDPPQTVRCHNWEPRRQALRVERDSEGNRKQKRTRRSSFIHLVPSSYRSQGESTIIHWQKTLHTGESFEQNNSTIGIKGNGYYFIYTQVLYQDQTFVMGHVVKRKERGRQKDEETLLRCTQNMPDTQPFNTCYSAGIYRLQRGDIIELVIPRSSANIIMEKDSTFMGLLKVGPI